MSSCLYTFENKNGSLADLDVGEKEVNCIQCNGNVFASALDVHVIGDRILLLPVFIELFISLSSYSGLITFPRYPQVLSLMNKLF